MATICYKPDGSGVPILHTKGSFYEVGYDIGKTFSERIKGYWEESKYVQEVLIPYAATTNGKTYCETTLDVCKSAFPQYITEIQGMADGSGISFNNLLLLSFEKEIQNVLAPKQKDTSLGCTDVLVNNPHCKIIAHNEDCYPLIDKFGYLVSARIIENDQEVESFTSYCYPGSLPGGSISFNRHGMVFTSDGLYPDCVVEKAPPRYFLSRAILKAKNIKEAVDLAKSPGFGMAYAFTFNIADVKDPSTMWSLEIGPQAKESVMQMYTLHEEADVSKPCHFIHANSILLLTGVKEIGNLSSRSRMERARVMAPPKTRDEALTILGDTHNKDFPLFRTATSKDRGATIFTAVFDILENRVDFYHGNPITQGSKSSFHFRIKDGSN